MSFTRRFIEVAFGVDIDFVLRTYRRLLTFGLSTC